MLAFLLGLLLALVNNFKPSEEEEKKCIVPNLNIVYHNHGEAVLAFALGLWLALVNNFKPSEEEERKCVVLSLKIIYRNHGKAVLAFCRAWKTSLYLVFFI